MLIASYEDTYRAMRSAATPVTGDLLKKYVAACQNNPWLKVGGIDFGDFELYVESDYPYYLERYDDLAMLKAFFWHGNWSIRSAVQYKDLIFVNQVDGGSEWWTLKIDSNGELVPFESISMRRIVECGKFEEYMERLCKATVEQCKSLNY